MHFWIIPMKIRLLTIHVTSDIFCEIYLVDDRYRTLTEHHRVLVCDIVTLSGRDYHNAFFRTEEKVSRANHVTDIFNKEDINLI